MPGISDQYNVINNIILTEQTSAPSTPPSGKQRLYVTSASGLILLNSGGSAVAVNIKNSTPTSASATGVTGTVYYDANYIYVCTATNTWKRTAITTW